MADHAKPAVAWLTSDPDQGLPSRGFRGRRRRENAGNEPATRAAPASPPTWKRPDGPAPMSEWLNDGVLLVGGDDGPTAALAAQLPVEPDMVTVVGLLSRDEDWWWVADAVAFAVPAGTAVRLAVSYAGLSTQDGAAPAAQLARQLAVDVVAPDGPLVLTPSGTAFVATHPGEAGGGGQWLCYRPDGTAEALGPRHPAPGWASGVDRVAATVGSVRVAPVPCGLWVRRPGAGDGLRDDLVYAAPADPVEVLMVVGAPGDEPPDPVAVADVADELPANLAGRLVLAPYASGSDVVLAVARELAGRWRREVLCSAGLPVVTAGGATAVAATDDEGVPRWRPLAPRLRVGPGNAQPSVAPAADELPQLKRLARHEAGVYLLNDEWAVEVCWLGLWLRRADRPRPLPPLADAEWDARWLTVLVDDGASERELSRLSAFLPRDASSRIRVRPLGNEG